MKKLIDRAAVVPGKEVTLSFDHSNYIKVSTGSVCMPSGYEEPIYYITVEKDQPEPRIEITQSQFDEAWEDCEWIEDPRGAISVDPAELREKLFGGRE